MKKAFPKATELHKQAETVGTASAADIRKAGFDVIHDPTRKFPNHARVVHPDGAAGFNPTNLAKLQGAFQDSSTV